VVASKLIVAADHRGTHLGIELMRTATQMALRRGWRYCFLETYENLVALYERVGFVIRGQSQHPVYGSVTVMEWDMLDVDHLRAVRSPMLKDAMAFISTTSCAA
jgi:predicted GNAT family N-acyltransferase